MAEKTVLECDGCQRAIEKSEVDVLLLGIPTGAFDDKLRPIFTPVHACGKCAETLTMVQLNVKLRSRPE
jgi:hypothetical protein